MTTPYSTNNLNQYTQVGTDNPNYDNNGNLKQRGASTYFYDALNRLTSATTGAFTKTFTYDGRNRRVSKTIPGQGTVYYYYDQWNLLEEHDGSDNTIAAYVHGAVIDELLTQVNTLGTIYYLYNALGNTMQLTDTTGKVVEKYTYDVFGAVTLQDATGAPLSLSKYLNRFLFTGREYLTELTLYEFRNRFYDPVLGRFLQTDPLRFEGGDVNFYRFVGNNIINQNDVFGLQCPPPLPPGWHPPMALPKKPGLDLGQGQYNFNNGSSLGFDQLDPELGGGGLKLTFPNDNSIIGGGNFDTKTKQGSVSLQLKIGF